MVGLSRNIFEAFNTDYLDARHHHFQSCIQGFAEGKETEAVRCTVTNYYSETYLPTLRSLSDLQTSEMEHVDSTSTDSTSSTLPPNAPWPVQDLDNVKSDGQKQ